MKCLTSIYEHSIFSVIQLTKSPKNIKSRVRFLKIVSNGINFIITKIPKLIKRKENLWFIMPSKGTYGYALLIDTCYRNPMFGKYTLHNLQGQSMQSYFVSFF